MPVVVDEVVISVEITGGAAAPGPAPGADDASIVEQCVERVLEVLRRREER